jgi:hypothetical protein
MTELFDIKESKSPRLAWLEKHKIATLRGKPDSWAAWTIGKPTKVDQIIGYGESEDEAIADWAIKTGMRLWNEEYPAP